MNKTEKLKNIILDRYNSIREFARICDIPSTTLTSALDKDIGGMAVDRVIKICEVLNIDVKTFEPIKSINKPTIDIFRNSTTSIKEQTLLSSFNKLNDIGKNEAIKRVEELTYIPKYINDEIDTIAAHNDFVNDENELKTIKEDIEDMKNW